MSQKIAQWITVNGNHIPIFEGESKKQAVERFTARQSQVKSEEQQKQRQIESTKKESEKKNDSGVIKNRKQAQLAIVQKYNPKDKNINSQATWVESEDDIKTWKECMNDTDSGYDVGDDVTPDFTWEDAQKAQESGYITVYSSKPIQQGTFVTPSKMIAVSYGNKNPYSKRVPVDNVAWIDRSEGQFADVDKETIANWRNKKKEPKDPNKLIPVDSYTKRHEYQQNSKRVQELYKELDPLQKQFLSLADDLEKVKDKHVTEEDRKALGGTVARMFVNEKAYPDVAEVAERYHKVANRKNEVEDEISELHQYFKANDGVQSKIQREKYGRPEFKEAHGEYEGFKRDESTDSGVDEAVKKGKARVVEMTPEQYIHECAHYIFEGSTFERTLRGRIGDKDTEKYAKMMREGVKFDTPYLKYNAIGEGGQEGLHRAVAAYINGYEKIPVIIIGKRRKY